MRSVSHSDHIAIGDVDPTCTGRETWEVSAGRVVVTNKKLSELELMSSNLLPVAGLAHTLVAEFGTSVRI